MESSNLSSFPSSQLPQTPDRLTASVGPQASGRSNADQLQRLVMEMAHLKSQNDALADAVVNSAEIIEELEQTKLKLAQTQSAAEQARKNSQLMADTIFDETHDAMVLLDGDLALISANRNARKMFGITAGQRGSSVMQQLTLQYRSETHLDWLLALLTESEESRIELFKHEKVVGDEESDFSPHLISSQNNLHNKHWIEVSISLLRSNIEGVRYLLTAHDITRRKLIEGQFQHQALHDNVTGLPNRRFFIMQMESLLSDADGPPRLVVCFLDLDNFKTVNDTLGHVIGDQLLVQVAQRIQATTRDECFLARFGGDEFALLMPGLSEIEIAAIGKRIVSELRRPFNIDGNSVYVGASIGVTRCPEDAQDVETLLQNADVAMYSAKDAGRNCFHTFTPELAASIQNRQSVLDDLRKSLESKDIALEYQPKWCLRTNQLAGCEALLRWKRSGVPVSPALLVEVAECSGLILPLGDLIVETAVKQVALWRRDSGFKGIMAINLSPRQLVDRGFTKRFQDIIAKAGVPAEAIELEVTETAMMENFDGAFDRIRELKELGAAIAIDDFGTGYSSMSYLKSFPVTTLKIDQSFISNLPDDPKEVAVAEAVISLGHGLGLNVVAEGVENERQKQFLVEAGCDLAQGYLYSPSLKPDDFVAWAKRQETICQNENAFTTVK